MTITNPNNARAIDPKTLRAFVVVAREGNVSRAAERLHLSQPAVSLQLQRLAEMTKLQLFTRTSTGLALTRDGAALLPQAERALAALVEFAQVAQRMRGSVRGRLRIGTILDPEFTRLGAFLRELVGLAPELEPELHHGVSGDISEQIARGALDVGYCLAEPGKTAQQHEFHSQVLTRFTYRVVAPAGWEANVLGRNWAALARLPWIGTPPKSVHHRLLAGIFSELGIKQTRVALVDQEASMLALVRSGVGLSLARDSIAIRESQAHGLVIADRVAIESALSFMCLKAHRSLPPVQSAWDAILRVWRPDA
jgi:DNA-binding transcriptional LysR family regulator